jgi:hypothetical protein
MPNALADTLAPPPAPNPEPQQQTALPPPTGGNALASLLGGGQQQGGPAVPGQQQQQAPAPTHAQTVAALRHFQIIGKELEGLLLNPEIGKADIRSAIIDAVTRLVADRIISPAEAVSQLGQVPDRPFDQKQTIENMYKQTMMAESAVLDHHGATNAPLSEDFGTENALYSSNPDQHQQMMSDMMQAHYGAKTA